MSPIYQPSLYQYLNIRPPEVVSISDFEGSRIYEVEHNNRSYNILSATSLLGWDTEDKDVAKYYAKKLGGRSSFKEVTEEDLAEAAFFLRFSQLRGDFYDLAVLRSAQLAEWEHPILKLPRFETAKYVFFQQQVFDLDENLGGTFDILILHEDGTWTLHDIKTHGRIYSPEQEKADVGVWALDRSVQSGKETKWRQQGVIYSKALSNLGVEVSEASIFCQNMHTCKLDEMCVTNGEQLKKKWLKNVKPKMDKIRPQLFYPIHSYETLGF